MVRIIKKKLYFAVAKYFRFFASKKLQRWQPRIVVVTGSNGKTTALHLLESQLGKAAKYSHRANSTFGIPFDILGLKRRSFSPLEWFALFFKAPFVSMGRIPKEKIYVVEADCDRVGEGEYLARFLKPEITLWLNTGITHSQNFDKAVGSTFASVEDAIAYEFGHFLAQTTKLCLINGDDKRIMKEADRSKAQIQPLYVQQILKEYSVTAEHTTFTLDKGKVKLPFLLPKETAYALAAALEVTSYFDQPSDLSFPHFSLPPGRSSLFAGIRDTLLVDSSYNANLSSLKVIVDMVKALPHASKWAIIGDLIELGEEEKAEHEGAAHLLGENGFDRVILVGPRLAKHTYPILLQELGQEKVVSFMSPREALDYLLQSLQGGELLLFKGARFLEGIVEHLLADKANIEKLCRREEIWQKRRKAWGL